MLDMNKGGSRDFFSLDEHQQHLENREEALSPTH